MDKLQQLKLNVDAFKDMPEELQAQANDIGAAFFKLYEGTDVLECTETTFNPDRVYFLRSDYKPGQVMPTPDMPEEPIKECPYCGNLPEVSVFPTLIRIQCGVCKKAGVQHPIPVGKDAELEMTAAIDDWDNRPIETALEDEIGLYRDYAKHVAERGITLSFGAFLDSMLEEGIIDEEDPTLDTESESIEEIRKEYFPTEVCLRVCPHCENEVHFLEDTEQFVILCYNCSSSMHVFHRGIDDKEPLRADLIERWNTLPVMDSAIAAIDVALNNAFVDRGTSSILKNIRNELKKYYKKDASALVCDKCQAILEGDSSCRYCQPNSKGA
jgi:hypothetical protein